MTSRGYFATLRETNQSVRVLTEELSRYENNKAYLQTLEEEFAETKEQHASLQRKWSEQYAPAVAMRQELESELQLARAYPSKYYLLLREQHRDTPTEDLKKLIKDLCLPCEPALTLISIDKYKAEADSSDTATVTGVSTSATENSSGSATLTSVEGTISAGEVKRSHRSWSLSAANQRLEALKELKKDMSAQSRSIASRSCELTARIFSLTEDIKTLEMTMEVPPHLLYKAVKQDLKLHKKSSLEEILRGRDPCYFSDSLSQDLKVSQNPVHSRYDSTGTNTTTPSWAISVGSSVESLSNIGSDFIRDTETSFGEITAKWF